MTQPATTRRDLLRLGTSAAAYAAGAAIVTGGVALASEAKGATALDTAWTRIRADYETARSAEAAAAHVEDSRMGLFFEWRSGNPAPTQPASPPIDTGRALRDIIADTNAPEWKERWAAYERERAAWTATSDAKHASLMGDAEERHSAAMHASDAAFDRLRTYPVISLGALAEKATMMHARFGDAMDNEDALAFVRDIVRLASLEG